MEWFRLSLGLGSRVKRVEVWGGMRVNYDLGVGLRVRDWSKGKNKVRFSGKSWRLVVCLEPSLGLGYGVNIAVCVRSSNEI